MLLWYRTTIELEYHSSPGERGPIEPANITGKWDKLEACVHNLAFLGPGKLNAITDPGTSEPSPS
jgi:hypothetical protein